MVHNAWRARLSNWENAWWPCHAQETLRGLRITFSRREDALHRLHRATAGDANAGKKGGGGWRRGPNSIGSDGRRGTGGAAEMEAAQECTAKVAAPVRVGVGESTGRGIMP